MDHLPQPSVISSPPVKIPYVCLNDYDGGEFLLYPERLGWQLDALLEEPTWTRLDQEGCMTSREAASLLQSWLFFGSLQAMFGRLIHAGNFIDTDPSGQIFVHTRSLSQMATDFMDKMESHGPVDVENFAHLKECFRWAYQVYNRAASAMTIDPTFLLSIRFTLDFLNWNRVLISDALIDNGRSELDAHLLMPQVPTQPRTEIMSGSRDQLSFAVSQLMLSGWCPHSIERLDPLGYKAQFFAMQMDNNDFRSHQSCTRATCVAYHIDKTVYRHQHVQEDCKCSFLSVDMGQLCAILSAGSIPVVKPLPTHGQHHPMTLALEPSRPGVYVAISHVWSDGMGNPTSNSIATCQIQRIFGAVADIPSHEAPTPIWLDTLCCPVDPKHTKKLAISKMKQTYEEAACVLVLDKSLEGHASATMTPFEHVLRIYISGWMTRLWTWQEGAAAAQLYFKFLDAVLDFDTLDCWVAQGGVCWSEPHSEFAQLYGRVRGQYREGELDLPVVAKGLEGRSTSYRQDEPICVGAILGCNLFPILKAPDSQSAMAEFWTQCPSIPSDIVFWEHERLGCKDFAGHLQVSWEGMRWTFPGGVIRPRVSP